MTRLLNANFARLFKGKLFWICEGAAVSLGLIEVFTHIKNPTNNPEFVFRPEVWLFNMSGFVLLIITAILVGFFVGGEHGGVLRNKIIVGKNRASIYLADLFACCIGVLIIHALFVITIFAAGIICGGQVFLKAEEILLFELLRVASLLSMCAFFTTLSMLIPKKLAGAVAALVAIFAFFFISNSVSVNLLKINQKIEEGTASSSDIVEREVLSITQDVLPFGQHDRLRTVLHSLISNRERELAGYEMINETSIPVEIAPSALFVFVLTTAVGVLIFRRKDIK